MRWLVALALALFLPLSAQAQCVGQDLIAALPPADQASLREAADAVPFAKGNFWQAQRDGEVVYLVGTMHLADDRFDAVVDRLAPVLQGSGLLLVEAGPLEMAQLKTRMAEDPSLVINTTGPTLPEVMPEADWQALVAALKARGIPGFMAAKFRPWYVAVVLGLPACAMAQGVPDGLDQRLMRLAEELDTPVQALEAYDAAFNLLQGGTPEEQMRSLTAALAAEGQAQDMAATMINLYFAQDVWLSWEFTKLWSRTLPGVDPATAEADLKMMQEQLMDARNKAWIPVIEEAVAASDAPVFVAFGALHLAGEMGVLNLLQAEGFVIEPLDID